MKTALIFGITGQDGSYLAELLLEKGYTVHGVIRRSSTTKLDRIEHIKEQITLHYGDLLDSNSINELISKLKPDEVYNLAAQSQVRISFDIPEYTCDVTGLGTLRILDAIKNFSPKSKFYQASSSEMFGKVKETPQNEDTPFYSRSPYGLAKVFAYWVTVNYRESYGIYAVNGILFNHESERRDEMFVSRKITKGIYNWLMGYGKPLSLGNLDAKRDWGYAKDYVEGIWQMMQQDAPSDFVLATGETHTVREFVEESCKRFNINLKWEGKGSDEKGIASDTDEVVVTIDPALYRPAEVDLLIGDYSKANRTFGWKPKTTFKKLVNIMCRGEKTY